MNESFSVGDVVQLTSSVQRMTVEAVNGEDISCVWLEGKTSHRNVFAATALKPYSPPPITMNVIR